jgi:hypothetical protein
MFIRLQKETVTDEEKDMDIVYKLIRSEYIRRGEAYPIEILERELIRATKQPKQKVYSIINKLAYKDMDINLYDEMDDSGTKQKYVDFVSILEKFDRKGVAQKKAKKYLSERLADTMAKTRGKTLKISNDTGSQKASDLFINSLTTTYSKKEADEKKFQERQKDSTLEFTERVIPGNLKDSILKILKKEYTYRIENDDKYPDFHFPVSEIASQIQIETRITPGELYPILESLSNTDIQFELINNPEEPEDKLIHFFPIADDDLNYTISNFRPEEYKLIKIKVTKQFFKFFKRKRVKATFNKLKTPIHKDSEEQKQWKSLLNLLGSKFDEYSAILEKEKQGGNIKPLIESFPKKDIDIYDF